MARYPIPAATVRFQETISRSRFITTVAAAATPEQARGLVAEVRAEFPDASHHCFAYVAGPPGSTAQIGMSDDGEPGGTAGRPMLAVLLGTGGLVRAYSGGVKAALTQLPLQEKVVLRTLVLGGAYHWISALDRLLPSYEAQVDERTFDADVTWHISVPEECCDALVQALTELSRGEIRITSMS
jgi:putative IMPACT (imprinted ancient) family translation regulator